MTVALFQDLFRERGGDTCSAPQSVQLFLTLITLLFLQVVMVIYLLFVVKLWPYKECKSNYTCRSTITIPAGQSTFHGLL